MAEVDHAFPCRGEATVGVTVLGVSQGDVGSEQIHCLADDHLHVGAAGVLEEVRRVEHDPKGAGGEHVKETPRTGRRADDVGEFRFDADQDALPLCDGDQMPELGDHFVPRFRGIVVGMAPPLILRVEASRADGDNAASHARRHRGEGFEAAATSLALLLVRVGHVVGRRNGGDLHPRFLGGDCQGVDRLLGNFRWQCAKAGTRHVVLDPCEPGVARRPQHPVRRFALEGLCEDAELHQSAPETSDSLTAFPVSTERAMATIARTEATPSTMLAPASERSSRIEAAKLSSCRR